jgi:hypothetical protein
MTTLIEIILAVFILLIVIHFITRYVYNYKLQDSGIRIMLFRIIPLVLIPYNYIKDIRRVTWVSYYKTIGIGVYLHCPSRIWGHHVLIEDKKKRISRYTLITPDNPDEFIAEVKKHLSKDTIIES